MKIYLYFAPSDLAIISASNDSFLSLPKGVRGCYHYFFLYALDFLTAKKKISQIKTNIDTMKPAIKAIKVTKRLLRDNVGEVLLSSFRLARHWPT